MQYDTCLYKKTKLQHTKTQGEGRKYEDTGSRQPSTSHGERTGADLSLTALRRNHPCQHLEFGLLFSRTVRGDFCGPKSASL